MTERSIILSADEVKATLAGRMTLVVRPIKPQPVHDAEAFGIYWNKPNRLGKYGPSTWPLNGKPGEDILLHSPFGAPGDRVWCKETFRDNGLKEGHHSYYYKADDPLNAFRNFWNSPVYMPRKASRLTLEVKDVRVKRIQEILNAECVLAGFEPTVRNAVPVKERFRDHWVYKITKSEDGWMDNPWCWFVEFRVVRP